MSARALIIELCDGPELKVAAGAGELPADLIGQRVRLEGTVASAALRSQRSQQMTDELNQTGFAQLGWAISACMPVTASSDFEPEIASRATG